MAKDSSGAELTTVSFRIPRWLKAEIRRVAGERLSDSSSMFREALLAWLKCQKGAA